MEVVRRTSLSVLSQTEWQVCEMGHLAVESGGGNGKGHIGCSVSDLVTVDASRRGEPIKGYLPAQGE